ncbi:hypothetical protein JKP88DRAFT_273836 [Tribonema minus]|uniref:Uncharacterized protein n=1 Tax=Tribonema minus TaxID=303371 RepID=A0A836C9Z3_9STRA|nr:hypothetical protein JKP88DRAFT_273836 [Tribonema minus]
MQVHPSSAVTLATGLLQQTTLYSTDGSSTTLPDADTECPTAAVIVYSSDAEQPSRAATAATASGGGGDGGGGAIALEAGAFASLFRQRYELLNAQVAAGGAPPKRITAVLVIGNSQGVVRWHSLDPAAAGDSAAALLVNLHQPIHAILPLLPASGGGGAAASALLVVGQHGALCTLPRSGGSSSAAASLTLAAPVASVCSVPGGVLHCARGGRAYYTPLRRGSGGGGAAATTQRGVAEGLGSASCPLPLAPDVAALCWVPPGIGSSGDTHGGDSRGGEGGGSGGGGGANGAGSNGAGSTGGAGGAGAGSGGGGSRDSGAACGVVVALMWSGGVVGFAPPACMEQSREWALQEGSSSGGAGAGAGGVRGGSGGGSGAAAQEARVKALLTRLAAYGEERDALGECCLLSPATSSIRLTELSQDQPQPSLDANINDLRAAAEALRALTAPLPSPQQQQQRQRGDGPPTLSSAATLLSHTAELRAPDAHSEHAAACADLPLELALSLAVPPALLAALVRGAWVLSAEVLPVSYGGGGGGGGGAADATEQAAWTTSAPLPRGLRAGERWHFMTRLALPTAQPVTVTTFLSYRTPPAVGGSGSGDSISSGGNGGGAAGEYAASIAHAHSSNASASFVSSVSGVGGGGGGGGSSGVCVRLLSRRFDLFDWGTPRALAALPGSMAQVRAAAAAAALSNSASVFGGVEQVVADALRGGGGGAPAPKAAAAAGGTAAVRLEAADGGAAAAAQWKAGDVLAALLSDAAHVAWGAARQDAALAVGGEVLLLRCRSAAAAQPPQQQQQQQQFEVTALCSHAAAAPLAREAVLARVRHRLRGAWRVAGSSGGGAPAAAAAAARALDLLERVQVDVEADGAPYEARAGDVRSAVGAVLDAYAKCRGGGS